MRSIENYEQAFAEAKRKTHEDSGKAANEARGQLVNQYTTGIPVERVKQLCNAERDGRCVVLPCKVGNTVESVQYGKGEVVAWDTTARVKFTYDVKPDWPYMNYDIGSKIFENVPNEVQGNE